MPHNPAEWIILKRDLPGSIVPAINPLHCNFTAAMGEELVVLIGQVGRVAPVRHLDAEVGATPAICDSKTVRDLDLAVTNDVEGAFLTLVAVGVGGHVLKSVRRLRMTIVGEADGGQHSKKE